MKRPRVIFKIFAVLILLTSTGCYYLIKLPVTGWTYYVTDYHRVDFEKFRNAAMTVFEEFGYVKDEVVKDKVDKYSAIYRQEQKDKRIKVWIKLNKMGRAVKVEIEPEVEWFSPVDEGSEDFKRRKSESLDIIEKVIKEITDRIISNVKQ